MGYHPEDLRAEPDAWARAAGVSTEATRLLADCDAVDLHIESFIWTRLFGYDLGKRHGPGILRGRLLSQADVPRVLESGLTGSVWSIATNPLRPRSSMSATLVENLRRLRGRLERASGRVRLVSGADDYREARSRGLHGCWTAIQGGNAIGAIGDLDDVPDGWLSRVTLVHMSDSHVGATSNPLGRRGGPPGLTGFGRDLVRALDERRILVDLAHIHEQGFRDAIEVHDPSLPVVVSHTGLRSVCDVWRNLSDDQVRAVADTGGVVGIMAHTLCLAGAHLRVGTPDMVRHVRRVIDLCGEDHVAIGTDLDGFILTPRDMRTVRDLPVLVESLLRDRLGSEVIRKVLGGNWLRVLDHLHG